MKKGNHLGTSQNVFNCLVKHKQYHDNEEWEAETGIQLKAKSRTFVFVELVGVENDVLRDMAGIKSHHCFVTCGGYVLMFPTFCTCQPCRNMEYDECEQVESREQGGGKRIEMKTFVRATQEKAHHLWLHLRAGVGCDGRMKGGRLGADACGRGPAQSIFGGQAQELEMSW